MGKKVIVYLSIIVLAVVMTIGCSKNNNEKVVGETQADTNKKDTTEVDAAQDKDTEITVFIAASLKNAMIEIQSIYEKENPDITILYNADSSGTLMTQIEEGADCDIFFSAAEKQITALEEEGMVEEGTIKKFLGNQVVLIKASDAKTKVTGFEDITKAESLALANEDVPAGAYAREIFTSIGNLQGVMDMEINECANVTAVLMAVSEMSNEVGVVYATDAASMSDTINIIATASDDLLENPVIYPVARIVREDATEKEMEAANNFIEFLETNEAKEIFEKYSFVIYQE